jgi:hypothetical protein
MRRLLPLLVLLVLFHSQNALSDNACIIVSGTNRGEFEAFNSSVALEELALFKVQ